MGSDDRRSYDTGASGDAQTNISAVVSRLETVIGERDRAVKRAMSDFRADGVSDQYHGVEQRWNRAASEVRTIIRLLKGVLEKNDGTAAQTLTRAKNAVDGIG
jgi:hypothetical protein